MTTPMVVVDALECPVCELAKINWEGYNFDTHLQKQAGAATHILLSNRFLYMYAVELS